MDANELGDLLLEVLPPDGSTLGNLAARQALSRAAEREVGEEEYDQIRDKALLIGTIKKGRGRGGSIALGDGIEGGSRYEAPSAPARGSGRRSTTTAEPEPTFQIGQKLTLSQLESFLWKSADILRGSRDEGHWRLLGRSL